MTAPKITCSYQFSFTTCDFHIEKEADKKPSQHLHVQV